jgi:hypothetical protein
MLLMVLMLTALKLMVLMFDDFCDDLGAQLSGCGRQRVDGTGLNLA